MQLPVPVGPGWYTDLLCDSSSYRPIQIAIWQLSQCELGVFVVCATM